MSWLSRFEAWVQAPGDLSVAFAAGELPETPTRPSVPAISTYRAQAVAKDVAMSIPAMRRARAALLTIATFRLVAVDRTGQQLDDTDARSSWLSQPEPGRTSFATLAYLIDDGLWHDKAVIRATRTIYGTVAYIERVHPSRWQPIYQGNDPDTVASWVVDGRTYSPAQFADAGFLAFDFAGLGGLRRLGFPLLSLYGDLQAAAGRYARAPHPHAILVNHGKDLQRDEIDALLDEWEWARENRGVGYTNDALEYKAQGWNPKDLQLTEAREHAALEVARLLALPAFCVDATGGDSMTYANVIDRRKDKVEAIRPWSTVLEQTLSLDDRRAAVTKGALLPRGVRALLDPADYLRADAQDRMAVWREGLALNILQLDDVIAQEPLARKAAPA